jgi:hypothetical protein
LAIVVVFVSVAAVAAGLERYRQRQEIAGAQRRIDDIARSNRVLEEELERMRAPQWLALLARQRLGYVQPGETAVFVYKTEDSGIVSQPPAPSEPEMPNWRKWMRWVRGADAGLPAEAP